MHVWSSRVVVCEPQRRHRSGGAAGVSHDSPRAQMCTFQGSGLQKTPTKFHERTQERERRMKSVAGGGKKKSEILGCPAVVRRRVVRRRVVRRRVVQRRGVHRRGGGGPAEGSIGNGVQGSGFRVQFRFLGTKTETAQKQNEERDEQEQEKK